MLNTLLENVKNMDSKFRGAPFWAWNAALEPEKLRSQIRTMKQMGFGGFYMHSRTGLDTPYLSDQWFKCISACIDEAEKLGMEAWLYDEDRWPSGAAGGIVTANDEFKMRKLKYCQGNAPDSGTPIVRFELKTEGNKLLESRRLTDNEIPESGDYYTFYWEYMERSSWYNGETYLDTLNPAAVEEFVNVTHEEYYKRYGEKFGKSIPGIFSDEPCYIHGDVLLSMPWTAKLPDEFRKTCGYDLLDHLPELFFFGEYEVSKVRYDYYNLITNLFTKTFTGVIGKWCGEHNLSMTGHTTMEDYLSGQVLYNGAAMRFYEHMQIPGIDVLTEHWNVFNTIKQCTSVARQLGKERVMTESYACTGWDFPVFGHKALCDWQFALGVNQRCLHLSWYSMEAEGKRDYPASISSHSPWYEKYSVMEDYFARLSAALTPGDEIRDLLVIHPIESVWAVMIKDIPATDIERERRQIKPGTKAMDGFYTEQVAPLDKAHNELTNLLLSEHLDFDFGDEEHLSRFGSADSETLTLGQAHYSMVLIPQLRTIRSTTLDLLEKFTGKVFYLGTPPEFVDALPSERAVKLFEKFTQVSMTDIPNRIPRRVSITSDGKEAHSVLYRLADLKDAYSFMLCNTSMKFSPAIKEAPMVRDRNIQYSSVEVSLELSDRGNLYELDLKNGAITKTNFVSDGKYYRFNTPLEQLETKLYFITQNDISNAPEKKNLPMAYGIPLTDTPMKYRLSESNKLVLDHAAWRIENGNWKEKNYILLVDDELRTGLGSAPRGGLMAQPWRWDKNKKWKSVKLELRYDFECETIPQSPCTLFMEHPELFSFELNGISFPAETDGFWMEDILRGVKIPLNLLKNGKNILTLRTDYNCGQRGLETVYLSGNFGVKNNNVITTLPETLTCGDWCSQNLPNYAGNLTYITAIELSEPALLKIGEWRGSLLGVKINDNEETILPWPPYQIQLPAGKSHIEITVYGHRRNALGPFYLNEKWPIRTGPYQHKVYEHPERQLVPCGLLSVPEILKIK